MKKRIIHIILFFAAFMPAGSVFAQWKPDLPDFPKNMNELKKSIKLTGTINVSTSIYAVTKINNRRPPFKFNVYGTPVLKINDLVIPIHFTLGTYQNKFRQEFNRLGISPTYKNLTLHLGYSTVSFSPLALQDHNFLGAGVEWKPGNWRLGYVYGRFQRKIEPDSIAFFQDQVTPSYNRTGMGVKAGYGSGDNYYDLVIFKGRDLEKSLKAINTWTIPSPAENAVVALSVRQTFLKNFQFNGDIAFSAYTANTGDPLLKPEGFMFTRIPALLMKDRASTQYLKAIQTSLKYRLKQLTIPLGETGQQIRDFGLDLKYDRVDPGYQSMGTYFFRNDLERISLNTSFRALDNRLTISIPLGFEHNNLFHDKQSTNRRMIGGMNVKYKHSQNLQLILTASNFRSKLFQEFIPGYDSLVVNQVDRNFNLSGTYLLERGGKKNKIGARIGFQSGKNITLDQPVKKLTKFFLTGSYTFDYQKLDLVLTPNMGLYYYHFTQFGNVRVIPSVTAKKAFLGNKLDASYNLGLILSQGLLGIRNQVRANYRINQKQGVTLQLFLINNISAFNPFTEFQLELRWYYRF